MDGLKFYREDDENILQAFGEGAKALKYKNTLKKYYYRAVHKSENSSNILKKYPLYVVLHKSAIEFRYSGKIDNADKAKTHQGTEFPENQILLLDLTKNRYAEERLDEQLRELFGQSFPISEDFKINLNPEDNNDNIYYTSHNILNRFPKENNNKINNNKIAYKTILLDFLYQFFEHPQTFKDDSNSYSINKLLRESGFIHAIYSKANFYYSFEHIRQEKYDTGLYESYSKDFVKDTKRSYENWITLLKNHEAHRIIQPINQWFFDIETELHKSLHFYKQTIQNTKQSKIREELSRTDIDLRQETTKWYIERNNILRAWLFNSSFERGVFWASLILIFFTILFFTLSVFFDKEIISFKGKLLIYIPLIIFPLISIIIGLFFQNNERQEFKWSQLVKRIIGLISYLMLPLWALIFGATHLVFSTQSFYNRLFVRNLWTVDFGIFLLALLFAIVAYKIAYRWSVKRTSQVLLRRVIFIFSFILFIILMSISLDVNAVSQPHSLITFMSLSLFLFGILFYHEKELHPNISVVTSVNKSLSMLFYGLVISFFINVFYINTEYKEYLETYEYLGHIWHHTKKDDAFKQKGNAYFIDDTLKLKEPYFGSYKIEGTSINVDTLSYQKSILLSDSLSLNYTENITVKKNKFSDTINLYSISESIEDDYYYSYFYVYEPDTNHTKKWAKYYFKEDLKKLKKERDKTDKINDSVGFVTLKSKIASKKYKLKIFDDFYKLKKDSIDSIYQYKSYDKVKKSIYQPMSDDIEVTIDKYFFDQLRYVYLYEKDGKSKNYIRASIPVIREINFFGIKIITIPNILFINTFLSLFVAVILQIFINKTGFFKGGAHGH